MTKLGYQPKILLPEGEFFRFEILSAVIEDGEYGYQLGLELKTLGGKHAGHTFKDWSKISGGEDDGLFIKEGSKAEELVRAVLGADADLEDLDTDALEGGRFMARVAVSQNGKRNRVDFGSIGRIPDEDSEEDERSELRRAHEEMRKVSATPAAPAGYVEGEDEPPPEEY
jgi:hypothetical protein